jgi:hypothetical protein
VGAPRIHGELLMLGIDISESTVARYMVRTCRSPSQGWKTFLRNHVTDFAGRAAIGSDPLIGFLARIRAIAQIRTKFPVPIPGYSRVPSGPRIALPNMRDGD